eukprot:1480009-Rhodomonas_salina.6
MHRIRRRHQDVLRDEIEAYVDEFKSRIGKGEGDSFLSFRVVHDEVSAQYAGRMVNTDDLFAVLGSDLVAARDGDVGWVF